MAIAFYIPDPSQLEQNVEKVEQKEQIIKDITIPLHNGTLQDTYSCLDLITRVFCYALRYYQQASSNVNNNGHNNGNSTGTGSIQILFKFKTGKHYHQSDDNNNNNNKKYKN